MRLKLRIARTNVEKLHELTHHAVSCFAVEPADSGKQVEVGQQDVVAYRKPHHQPKGALPGYHPDSRGNGMGRVLESACLTADLHSKRFCKAEQSPQNSMCPAA